MPAEPSCTQAPCNLGGSCGPGQSACALNEFNFTSTCPYSQGQPMNIDYNNRGKREAQMYGGNHEINNHIYVLTNYCMIKYLILRTISLLNNYFPCHPIRSSKLGRRSSWTRRYTANRTKTSNPADCTVRTRWYPTIWTTTTI